jgi:hypothetical protein
VENKRPHGSKNAFERSKQRGRYEEMTPGNSRSERVRAWIFVLADPAPSVMEELYGKLGREGGDAFVVVRADVVDYGPYNVIVPVDAESDGVLHEVEGMIKGHPGVNETLIVRVKRHVPFPPHDAHGFITAREKELGRDPGDPCVDVGRFPKSPGHNAWG